jgi:hypothetical protein
VCARRRPIGVSKLAREGDRTNAGGESRARDHARVLACNTSTPGHPARIMALWLSLIHLHEKKTFSQNAEDGILRYIFANVGTTDKYYVEFGVQDGSERNTRLLAEKYNWTGLLMDGGNSNKAINLHRTFISTRNIRSLFQKYRVPREFDLLSIDLDTCDLWVWRKLCGGVRHKQWRPRVVVAEFNRNYDLYEYYTFPDDSKNFWQGDQLMGASLSAFYLAGLQMDYRLVYVDRLGINAFFVRRDVLERFTNDAPTLESMHPAPLPIHAEMSAKRRALRVDYWKWSAQHNLSTFSLPAPLTLHAQDATQRLPFKQYSVISMLKNLLTFMSEGRLLDLG